ncbi:MAG: glycosyltransferase family 39 protein, partial [Kiritimatiellales bacterium]|nr:glycosyltransferase family 39 protein [Kiritimatiellales bacterium]
YHLLAWTIIPLLCNTCLPLDSIEAVMWGSQWAWGYDKHPPLSAWAAELFTNLLDDGGLYLLSQLCIVVAGLGIYRLGRLLSLSGKQALYAVLLLDTVYYYQFISVEFNVNYMQLPFWAWGWYFGIDAVQNKRRISWLGLGVCVALGALTKYIAVFMLVPLFAAWVARGELKTAVRSPGLYLAGAVSILLFLPHLLWMMNHEWITITYGLRRGAGEQALW